MRRYDDPVDVRRGMVEGPGGDVEGPEQFLWRGRLWKVCSVAAHWVETGPWWRTSGADAVLGADDASVGGALALAPPATDLLAEREVWRVEAARGMSAVGSGRGVFDLVLDWTDGTWRLAGCVD
ncbi:MAG: DUF6504 family protein [Nocardioides sp.]